MNMIAFILKKVILLIKVNRLLDAVKQFALFKNVDLEKKKTKKQKQKTTKKKQEQQRTALISTFQQLFFWFWRFRAIATENLMVIKF